jgi:hypothetical protein
VRIAWGGAGIPSLAERLSEDERARSGGRRIRMPRL